MQNRKTPLIRKVVIIALFVTVYLFGFLHGHGNLVYEKNLTPKLVNREIKKSDSVDFSIFWEAYKQVEERYLRKIDPKLALEGAIKGMIGSTGDPYSVYLTKEESNQFLDDLNGKFEGVGAELTIQDGVVTVISPLDNSPAMKAGILPKDKIIAIDGKSSEGINLTEAVTKIRGASGTKVILTIVTPPQKASREVTIVRQSIKVDSVKLTVKNDVGIIKISQFGDDTTLLVAKYAKQLKKENIKGVVLDLRNNPGGLLESSVDVASAFIKEGVIVLEEDKDKKREQKNVSQEAILPDIPMVVVVNEGSASAAEIVAGAMQDHRRGKIIGKKSFGKGTVQDLVNLSDGSTLKVTIAEWLTPNGHTINHDGIKPEIEIEDDPKTESDEALDKAITILSENK